MRNKKLILAAVLFLGGCRGGVDNARAGLQIMEINGCQYVIYLSNKSQNTAVTMVHAGNCRNSIHWLNSKQYRIDSAGNVWEKGGAQ